MADNRKKVEAVLKDFILSNDVLLKVSALLLQEFNNGLGANTHETATVKMFPTFVRDVPNGSVFSAIFTYIIEIKYWNFKA
ncbi:UNVERIFIED_CONTAM: Hexokinase-2 [Trichonephila clavipes]